MYPYFFLIFSLFDSSPIFLTNILRSKWTKLVQPFMSLIKAKKQPFFMKYEISNVQFPLFKKPTITVKELFYCYWKMTSAFGRLVSVRRRHVHSTATTGNILKFCFSLSFVTKFIFLKPVQFCKIKKFKICQV